MSLVDELLGFARPQLRGQRRVVVKIGANEIELAEAKKRAARSRKNRRAAENRKSDPARAEARDKYLKDWERAHPDARRSYRAAWIMRNEEKHKKLQRERAKRRYAAKAKGGPARGERQHCAKLTADVVRSMRARYAAGGISMKSLGAEFGVSPTTARQVVRRLNWAHVKDEA